MVTNNFFPEVNLVVYELNLFNPGKLLLRNQAFVKWLIELTHGKHWFFLERN